MKRAALIAVFFVAEAVSAGVDAPLVVTLHERAQVTDAHIQLRDIAAVRGGDETRRQRMAMLRVGPAPRLGGARVWQQDEIKNSLRRQVSAKAFVIEGASVKVERSMALYAGAQFVEAAREHLRAHLQRVRPDLTKIEIESVSEPDTLRGPAGEARVTPKVIQGDGLGKRVCVWIDLEINGAPYRSVPVWLSVAAYRQVVVARRAFGSREPLSAGDFALEERDVAGVRGAPLGDMNGLMGARARRPLGANDVVLATDVEPKPPVLTEQEVDVRLVAGRVAIDTRAIAEEEGLLGEVIRVRNPASAATYTARVVGEGKALVVDR